MRILNASGCLDALAAPEVARQLDAFVTKTVTPEPREGNAPPRIAETAHGMLNAIGLANPGRERFLADNLPRLRELGVPLWVSRRRLLCRRLRRDLLASGRHRGDRAQPFLPERRRGLGVGGGDRRGLSPRRPQLPLYAKLSAAHPDVAEVARAVAAAGADGLSLINTLRADRARPRAFDRRWRAAAAVSQARR